MPFAVVGVFPQVHDAPEQTERGAGPQNFGTQYAFYTRQTGNPGPNARFDALAETRQDSHRVPSGALAPVTTATVPCCTSPMYTF